MRCVQRVGGKGDAVGQPGVERFLRWTGPMQYAVEQESEGKSQQGIGQKRSHWLGAEDVKNQQELKGERKIDWLLKPGWDPCWQYVSHGPQEPDGK